MSFVTCLSVCFSPIHSSHTQVCRGFRGFRSVNILNTFRCLLQFVVQLLLLVGQVGDITGQGAIGLFQLETTGKHIVSTR